MFLIDKYSIDSINQFPNICFNQRFYDRYRIKLTDSIVSVDSKESVDNNESVESNEGMDSNEDILNPISINNMIVAGPTSSGKNTFVKLLLESIYGADANKITDQEFQIKNYGSNYIRKRARSNR